MRAKLPIALALGALLVLPVLAQTLNSRASQAGNNMATAKTTGDTLLLPPGGSQSMGNVESLPSRGMTMAQVEKSHGAPVVRKSPVGEPPITRWEYSSYVVYFESQYVINSVVKVTR